MKRFNHHTHCNFCDGISVPEEYVKEALRLEFNTLGFSSHAPVPFENTFALTNESMPEYGKVIRNLQQIYADRIEIFLGLEIDYIPGTTLDFEFFRKSLGLDYVIGGVHLVKKEDDDHGLWFIDGPRYETYDDGLKEVFHNDIRRGVSAYYQSLCRMITTQKPDIIAHMDKIKMHNSGRFFTEDEPWYISLVDEALEVIAQSDCIVEINSRGFYKKRCPDMFPSLAILKKLNRLKIPITLSSDAHAPGEIYFGMDIAIANAFEAGYKEVWCLSKGKWHAVEID